MEVGTIIPPWIITSGSFLGQDCFLGKNEGIILANPGVLRYHFRIRTVGSEKSSFVLFSDYTSNFRIIPSIFRIIPSIPTFRWFKLDRRLHLYQRPVGYICNWRENLAIISPRLAIMTASSISARLFQQVVGIIVMISTKTHS